MKDKAIHDAMVSIENRVIHIYNHGFSDGYEVGKSEAKLIETIDNMNRQYRSGYSKGLEEAWECARKILFDSSLPGDILTDLCADSFCGIIQDCSASEAIAKLKEYEQKKSVNRDCEHCSKTYGTLGCCTTVHNEWVYSCEEGHREYEEQQKQSEKSCKNCQHGINGMPNFKSGRCEACYYDERIGGNCLFEEKQTEEKTDKSCDDCRFADLQKHEFPCCSCSASHTFRWEARK